MRRRSLGTIALAVALTIPWLTVWGATTIVPWILGVVPGVEAGYGVSQLVGNSSVLWTVLISGVSILGAAFLLAWAAETAEKDVPRAFAIAVLAVLAVAPEYAVDALYAWNAGQFAGTERGIEAGNLAVANMTGANRILIGLGWSGIALFTVYRRAAASDPAVEKRSGLLADAVIIDQNLGLEILFLLLATVWAFVIPLNGGINAIDTAVLVGLYATYITIVLRGDIHPHEMHTGVPAYIQSFSRRFRVASVVLLFVYAGLILFVAVEPFAHGLEELGTDVGIPSFFMIQWVAPLASESPELIVVAYLVNKTRSTAGFNALISSKLNQWTLLIGTLVVVYSIGLGQYGALPFDQRQMGEIWLTASQSFFAIAILVDLEITVREAVVLLLLFSSQVLLEFALIRGIVAVPLSSYEILLVYSGIYMLLGSTLFIIRRKQFKELFVRTVGTIRTAISSRDSLQSTND